jgi:hypothetical protein
MNEEIDINKIEASIFLQDILPLDSLNQNGKILLIRHSHDCLGEMNSKNLIEEYQSFQSKPAFQKCKYIVSFLGSNRNSAIFYGIYEVLGIKSGKNLPKYSDEIGKYCDPININEDFFLILNKLETFDKFKGRLVIDWIVPRGWYNTYGEVLNKIVLKILPKNFVIDFPGLMNVKLNYFELKKIIENPDSHSEWYNSLTKLQAVYLILDSNLGSHYVGTTYGELGLWQRWENYIKGDGTGGNIELIKLKNQNPDFYKYFQFSILEVLSKTADQKYCTDKETIWKEKLGSRVHGLNKN